MDPFSALGLAGNVIQFVDFGGRLLSGSLELYKSVDGTSSTNKELEFLVKSLNELCAGLSRPEHRIDQQQASAPELALLPLARSCTELGEELLSVLNALKVEGRFKKWESVRQALRSAGKEKEIRNYNERLNHYRSQIAMHITVILR